MLVATVRVATSTLPVKRSCGEAVTSATVPFDAPATVANLKPLAFISGIHLSSAATVSDRSPPASCMSTTEPVGSPGLGVALRMIASMPGRCQSSLSSVVKTVT